MLCFVLLGLAIPRPKGTLLWNPFEIGAPAQLEQAT